MDLFVGKSVFFYEKIQLMLDLVDKIFFNNKILSYNSLTLSIGQISLKQKKSKRLCTSAFIYISYIYSLFKS